MGQGVHRGGAQRGLHGGGCKGGHMGEDAVHGGGLCTGGPPGSECIGGTHTHMAAHGAAGMTEPPPDHPPPPTQTGTGRRRVKGARSPRPRPLRWEAEPKMAVAAAAAAMFSSAEVQALRNSFVTALGREDGAEEGPRDPGPPLRHSRAAPRPSQHPTYGRPPPPTTRPQPPPLAKASKGSRGSPLSSCASSSGAPIGDADPRLAAVGGVRPGLCRLSGTAVGAAPL